MTVNSIDVRMSDEVWNPVPLEQVRSWLAGSHFVYWYDRIDSDPDRVSVLDLATPAFLDAPPRFRSLLYGTVGPDGESTLSARLSGITNALAKIPKETELWDWPDGADARSAMADLLSSVRCPGYGLAMMTKMLHRKRPCLIPILDRPSWRVWGGTGSDRWKVDGVVDATFLMGRELGARENQLDALHDLASRLGPPFDSLTRLRLYDIVSYWAMRANAANHPKPRRRK